jgi:AcrR family transcriptional regulator
MKYAHGQVQLSPRAYRLGERQAASDATRARIIEAAREVLETSDSFSIDAVAQKAGVARMTVYYQFNSKRGLLEALFDYLAARGGMPQLPLAFQRPNPLEALEKMINVFAHFWASDRVVLRRLRGMAALDPELDEVLLARNEGRRNGLRAIVGRLPKEKRPQAQSVDDTVDLLHTLISFESFDVLAGKNRTPQDVAPIIQWAARMILAPPNVPQGGRDQP